MSYYDSIKKFAGTDIDSIFGSVRADDVQNAVARDGMGQEGFIALLSPKADAYLEPMARKAHETTLRYFGRTIQLYTPIYISDHCDNHCLYCGFKAGNSFERTRLTIDEVRKEAEFISATGLKHILVLTGDSRAESPLSYIKDCVRELKKYFSSISVEIYALGEGEYKELVDEGVDGLTIYQETYDEELYGKLHPSGPKSDYLYRLNAPERGAMAGMRNVNIGILLGLNDWRHDALLMGLHAKYLIDKYPDVELSISIPRLRPHAGNFKPRSDVSDKNVVQIITALRIFLPRLGITVSTRESSRLRENIMPLGVTKMSAGSNTKVGGRTKKMTGEQDVPQFEISDKRSVEEIKAALEKMGYQAVLKDWMGL
jgi:2-iminoacetate synthase